MTGAAVVGTGTVVGGAVVVGAGGMVRRVVAVVAAVVGRVGGTAACVVPHAVAVTPSTPIIAAARIDRDRTAGTLPF
jgi:hypothetical protein